MFFYFVTFHYLFHTSNRIFYASNIMIFGLLTRFVLNYKMIHLNHPFHLYLVLAYHKQIIGRKQEICNRNYNIAEQKKIAQSRYGGDKMTHEHIRKRVIECYEKKPLGTTIQTEEDRDIILKLAAVFETLEKPLPAKKMIYLLEKTGKIIEDATMWEQVI